MIRKRGKPVTAVVSTEDLEKLESSSRSPRGLMAAVGLFADVPEWEQAIDEIVSARQGMYPRAVILSAAKNLDSTGY